MQSLTPRNVLRGVLLAFFPWGPAYLFESANFWFGQTNNGYWYYQFSQTRLEADVVSFALGGILVAYLLRPRRAVLQVFISAFLIYVLFYLACPTYMAGSIWRSECYSLGPDGLAGVRLCAMMFSVGALPAIVRASYKEDKLNKGFRPWIAILGAFVTSVVTTMVSANSMVLRRHLSRATRTLPGSAPFRGVRNRSRDPGYENEQSYLFRRGFRRRFSAPSLRISLAAPVPVL